MVNGQVKYAKDSGDGVTEPFFDWSSKFIQGMQALIFYH